MKCRVRMFVLITATLAVATVALVSLAGRNRSLASLERTRTALRRQGFKLELSQFDFASSAETTARAAALDQACQACYSRLSEAIDFLPPVSTNAALVLWNEPDVLAEGCTNLWVALRASLNFDALKLACDAALSGPYRPRAIKDGKGGFTFPGGNADRLPDPLAAHILLALHGRDQAEASTSLLALTRLIAEWESQPFNTDFLYWRNVNLVRAYGITWQALQSHAFTEPQLATLQHEWEAADFRRGLPEMAAFARAGVELEYSRQGSRAAAPFRIDLLLRPKAFWQELRQNAAEVRYANSVRFQNEETLLWLFSDCEQEFRSFQTASTWQEIKVMPAFSRPPPRGTNLLKIATNALHSRFIGGAPFPGADTLVGVTARYPFGFRPPSQWQLWRFGDSEARRRLLVAALASERYRIRTGSYPDCLQSLVPDFLPAVPVDFMDGNPLRYRRADYGRFLLFSVGQDCCDDGGNSRLTNMVWLNSGRDHTDLVWPCPALPGEVAAEILARRNLPPTDTARCTFVRDR